MKLKELVWWFCNLTRSSKLWLFQCKAKNSIAISPANLAIFLQFYIWSEINSILNINEWYLGTCLSEALINWRQSTCFCGLLLNLNNTGAYTSSASLVYLCIDNALIIKNSPCLPYLDHSDFLLFHMLKMQLKGRLLESVKDARALVEGAFSVICQLMVVRATGVSFRVVFICMVCQDEWF